MQPKLHLAVSGVGSANVVATHGLMLILGSDRRAAGLAVISTIIDQAPRRAYAV